MATYYDPLVELSHGLEREPMHAYPTLDHDREELDKEAATESGGSRVRRKLRHVSQRIASKLHDTNEPAPPEQPSEPIAPTLAPPPTQETYNLRFTGEAVENESNLPAFKEFLHQPLDTLKSFAQKQGGKEFAEAVAKPDATHGASVKLVLAHEKVEAEAVDTEGHADATREVAGLMKARQDAFVRWTFARHVRNVKAVPPEPPPQHPRQDFVWRDEANGKPRMHWAEYGEHVRPR